MSGAFRAMGMPHHVIHRRSANARMSCHALCVEAQIPLALWGWMLMCVQRFRGIRPDMRGALNADAHVRAALRVHTLRYACRFERECPCVRDALYTRRVYGIRPETHSASSTNSPSHAPTLQAQLLARALPCLPLARDVRHNYRSCLGKSPKQLRFHIYVVLQCQPC